MHCSFSVFCASIRSKAKTMIMKFNSKTKQELIDLLLELEAENMTLRSTIEESSASKIKSSDNV